MSAYRLDRDVSWAEAAIFTEVEGKGQGQFLDWHSNKGGAKDRPVRGYVHTVTNPKPQKEMKRFFFTEEGLQEVLLRRDLSKLLPGLWRLGVIVRQRGDGASYEATAWVFSRLFRVPSEGKYLSLYEIDHGSLAGAMLAEAE